MKLTLKIPKEQSLEEKEEKRIRRPPKKLTYDVVGKAKILEVNTRCRSKLNANALLSSPKTHMEVNVDPNHSHSVDADSKFLTSGAHLDSQRLDELDSQLVLMSTPVARCLEQTQQNTVTDVQSGIGTTLVVTYSMQKGH